VDPTGTVIVCGPKTKLSIFISVAAEGWSLALTFGDTASISIAIIAGTTKPAIQTFFLVIVLLPF
jgi:hypothetical protein